MSALNKFVGKVAQQAAAEAVAKEAQLQRKNILLAGGLVAFGGLMYYKTFTALTQDDFSEVDVQEVRHRLDQRNQPASKP